MKAEPKPLLKVVAHRRDHKLIKGYTGDLPVSDLADLGRLDPVTLPRVLKVRTTGSNKLVSLPLASLKALFFVRSFEGSRQYKEIKFFEAHPPIEGLWVRLSYFDNESTEGVVRNSLDFLIHPGFFVKPPDPASNNEVVYVLKASLVDFQVLGVTTSY